RRVLFRSFAGPRLARSHRRPRGGQGVPAVTETIARVVAHRECRHCGRVAFACSPREYVPEVACTFGRDLCRTHRTCPRRSARGEPGEPRTTIGSWNGRA